MFKLTKLISLQPEISSADRSRVAAVLHSAGREDSRIRRSMLQPTMKGSMCAGGYIWHLQFADENDYRDVIRSKTWRESVDRTLASDLVRQVDSAAYRGGRGQVPEPGMKAGVYRALFVAVRPGAEPSLVRQFEAEMCEMPRYIPAIRNWAFSPVVEASGARDWSHVWEQDYQDLGGLQGPYMMHPFHWGFIDRWYNRECPEWMIDTHLMHTFCGFEESVFATV